MRYGLFNSRQITVDRRYISRGQRKVMATSCDPPWRSYPTLGQSTWLFNTLCEGRQSLTILSETPRGVFSSLQGLLKQSIPSTTSYTVLIFQASLLAARPMLGGTRSAGASCLRRNFPSAVRCIIRSSLAPWYISHIFTTCGPDAGSQDDTATAGVSSYVEHVAGLVSVATNLLAAHLGPGCQVLWLWRFPTSSTTIPRPWLYAEGISWYTDEANALEY